MSDDEVNSSRSTGKAPPFIEVRRSNQRGQADYGRLKTRYTFSFAGYFDPDYVRFGSLRAINEIWIAPGMGFDTHPHNDMEIITYILSGSLEHRDSIGNAGVIHAGEVQRITAGTGIEHSEFSPSNIMPTELLQIWIYPAEKGLPPEYEQRRFPDEAKVNRLCPIATPDGRDGSLKIHQSTELFASKLEQERELKHILTEGHRAWLQLISGRLVLNDAHLYRGDGAAIDGGGELTIRAVTDAHFLLFDMG